MERTGGPESSTCRGTEEHFVREGQRNPHLSESPGWRWRKWSRCRWEWTRGDIKDRKGASYQRNGDGSGSFVNQKHRVESAERKQKKEGNSPGWGHAGWPGVTKWGAFQELRVYPCMALHCTHTLVGNKGIMPWICLWKNVKILALHRERILGKATKWREFVNTSETKTSEGLAAEYIFKHVDWEMCRFSILNK